MKTRAFRQRAGLGRFVKSGVKEGAGGAKGGNMARRGKKMISRRAGADLETQPLGVGQSPIPPALYTSGVPNAKRRDTRRDSKINPTCSVSNISE